MMTPEQFRAEVESFLAESGMAPTRLGREALGDPSLVFQVRAGRTPGLRVATKVLTFISEYRAKALPKERAA